LEGKTSGDSTDETSVHYKRQQAELLLAHSTEYVARMQDLQES